jgi:hypothetical protein
MFDHEFDLLHCTYRGGSECSMTVTNDAKVEFGMKTGANFVSLYPALPNIKAQD